ncbi:longitudinals lacking protein, isoforms H/M/V [Halyomorpha halys]|uniref:longitudinals lacking protein, isoforms H/M/V n=1 Tax=Halyomorpha halys TaxID=286706 RepID=UPI0006D4FBC0|nr:longitudinals lacking protein, isoforms H/M/V-like [Halyomorpha halys]XP_014274267.1 longitudinals lacking protein, isoforms H/M/V-like [Halyomorpha halys]XP_014274268.1 longitudinals lacking protein, isoforms H/M/V-like [Halyomorpha halys]
MAVSDQFCLRWNDHQNTLMTTFDTLLDSQKLTDVTLFAGGKSLKAHKVVLSACSPYFDKMLEVHDEKNPIIVFNDLSYDQLRAMLEYMYRGEVNVSQEQLDSFLKVAESLKIKGLTDQGGGGDIKGGGTKKKALSTPLTKDRSPAGKRRRPNRRGSESGNESIEEEIKSEPGGLLQPKIELTEDNGGGGVEDLTMEEEEDDDGYYHHQAAGSSRLSDGSVQPPHPPPDIKDFASWEMTNDSFMGAQEMSGNNTLNSSQGKA